MSVTLIMGLLVFIVGLTMEVFSLMALLNIPPLQNVNLFERAVLFVGGVILMILGYAMARNLPQPSVTIEEIPPAEGQETEEQPRQ